MCWKWQQGTIVSWLPSFPTRKNHLTFQACDIAYTQTNNTGALTPGGRGGGEMTVREKAEMKIEIIS